MISGDIAAATVKHTGEKMTKEEAGYKHGLKQAHCGVCEHYSRHECSIVAGKIFPAMWCRYFERAK
jgi:hypothetical protein